jgi:nicotine blue oxidoreductase
MRAGGVDDILVIGRPEDTALATEVANYDARFIENRNADAGQLSSLLAGLNAADRPGIRAVLVMPVDIPLVRPETFATLTSAFVAGHAPLARVVHHGRHGHPVIFGRRLFDELRRADPQVGAKTVVHAHAAESLNVEVDDANILDDVDTPEDYRRMLSKADGA